MNAAQIIDGHVDTMRAVLAQIEEDVVTGYTLADAVREGTSVAGQATGRWVAANGDVCALTAAYIAAKARGYV